jgi:hypothetical protein
MVASLSGFIAIGSRIMKVAPHAESLDFFVDSRETACEDDGYVP